MLIHYFFLQIPALWLQYQTTPSQTWLIMFSCLSQIFMAITRTCSTLIVCYHWENSLNTVYLILVWFSFFLTNKNQDLQLGMLVKDGTAKFGAPFPVWFSICKQHEWRMDTIYIAESNKDNSCIYSNNKMHLIKGLTFENNTIIWGSKLPLFVLTITTQIMLIIFCLFILSLQCFIVMFYCLLLYGFIKTSSEQQC